MNADRNSVTTILIKHLLNTQYTLKFLAGVGRSLYGYMAMQKMYSCVVVKHSFFTSLLH